MNQIALPRVVLNARPDATLSGLEAVAGKLWLSNGGMDPGGALRRAVDAYWRASGGDAYCGTI